MNAVDDDDDDVMMLSGLHAATPARYVATLR